jgi:addiction module HigA family antidote
MTSTSKTTTEPLGRMKNPSHPGDLVLFGVLEPLGISVTRAAEMLGVRRATLSDVVNGKASMSAEMAFRLHKVFGISAELMLRVQNQYDLARVRENARTLRLKRYSRKAA